MGVPGRGVIVVTPAILVDNGRDGEERPVPLTDFVMVAVVRGVDELATTIETLTRAGAMGSVLVDARNHLRSAVRRILREKEKEAGASVPDVEVSFDAAGRTRLTWRMDSLDLDEVWKTRDGRLIPVCDLDEGHLVNALSTLRSGSVEGARAQSTDDRLIRLDRELKRRGLVEEEVRRVDRLAIAWLSAENVGRDDATRAHARRRVRDVLKRRRASCRGDVAVLDPGGGDVAIVTCGRCGERVMWRRTSTTPTAHVDPKTEAWCNDVDPDGDFDITEGL